MPPRIRRSTEKKVAENAKIIIDQVAFMSRTMDDFSGFTSPKDRIKEFYICEACSDALRLVEHTINYNHVNVHVSCGERIPVTGSKNDLIHVLINLITNSIDAFSSRKIENPEIRICAEKCNDKKCEIVYRDNAGGLRGITVEEIFEPYLSTKPKESGTGIGLYLARNILKKVLQGEYKCRKC